MKVGILAANTMPHATPDGAAALARAAEAAGIESLWTVEHVLWPDGYSSTYPYAETGRMPGPPTTVPWPPVSAAPPMTTAAITCSSRPSAALGSPLPPCANISTPAQPVSSPASV